MVINGVNRYSNDLWEHLAEVRIAMSPSLSRLARACPRRIAVALLLGAIGGCGLAEYEAKMEDGQKRIDYLDKQNAYLGGAIEPPPPEKAPAGPDGTVTIKPKIELFLRVPKGIETKFEPVTVGGGGLLYRYPRELATAHPAQKSGSAPAKQPPEFQEVLVAVSTDRDRNEFWQAILQPFGGFDTSSMTRETLQAPGRPPLNYEKLAFEAPAPPTNYFCFVHQAQNVFVAVVFSVKRELATNPDVVAAMEYSLKSLGVGAEATALRSRFRPPN
jgi:hypothetical protein